MNHLLPAQNAGNLRSVFAGTKPWRNALRHGFLFVIDPMLSVPL